MQFHMVSNFFPLCNARLLWNYNKNLLLQVLLNVAYISSVNKHLSATKNKKKWEQNVKL